MDAANIPLTPFAFIGPLTLQQQSSIDKMLKVPSSAANRSTEPSESHRSRPSAFNSELTNENNTGAKRAHHLLPVSDKSELNGSNIGSKGAHELSSALELIPRVEREYRSAECSRDEGSIDKSTPEPVLFVKPEEVSKRGKQNDENVKAVKAHAQSNLTLKNLSVFSARPGKKPKSTEFPQDELFDDSLNIADHELWSNMLISRMGEYHKMATMEINQSSKESPKITKRPIQEVNQSSSKDPSEIQKRPQRGKFDKQVPSQKPDLKPIFPPQNSKTPLGEKRASPSKSNGSSPTHVFINSAKEKNKDTPVKHHNSCNGKNAPEASQVIVKNPEQKHSQLNEEYVKGMSSGAVAPQQSSKKTLIEELRKQWSEDFKLNFLKMQQEKLKRHLTLKKEAQSSIGLAAKTSVSGEKMVVSDKKRPSIPQASKLKGQGENALINNAKSLGYPTIAKSSAKLSEQDQNLASKQNNSKEVSYTRKASRSQLATKSPKRKETTSSISDSFIIQKDIKEEKQGVDYHQDMKPFEEQQIRPGSAKKMSDNESKDFTKVFDMKGRSTSAAMKTKENSAGSNDPSKSIIENDPRRPKRSYKSISELGFSGLKPGKMSKNANLMLKDIRETYLASAINSDTNAQNYISHIGPNISDTLENYQALKQSSSGNASMDTSKLVEYPPPDTTKSKEGSFKSTRDLAGTIYNRIMDAKAPKDKVRQDNILRRKMNEKRQASSHLNEEEAEIVPQGFLDSLDGIATMKLIPVPDDSNMAASPPSSKGETMISDAGGEGQMAPLVKNDWSTPNIHSGGDEKPVLFVPDGSKLRSTLADQRHQDTLDARKDLLQAYETSIKKYEQALERYRDKLRRAKQHELDVLNGRGNGKPKPETETTRGA